MPAPTSELPGLRLAFASLVSPGDLPGLEPLRLTGLGIGVPGTSAGMKSAAHADMKSAAHADKIACQALLAAPIQK